LIDCVCFLWDWDLVSRVFRNILSITLHICDFSIYFCISLGTYLGPTYLDITIQSFTSIKLSSFASLDAISTFTPIQVAFACQAKVRETGVLPCRRSRFVALQRMSSHNPTTTHTRGPSYLTQLLITLKIIVMNCMLRTGYR